MTVKKTLQIKNQKSIFSLSDETFTLTAQKWQELQIQIQELLTGAEPPPSLQEMFQNVQNLHNNFSYSFIITTLEEIFRVYLKKQLGELKQHSTDFLNNLSRLWNEFYAHIVTMKNVFIVCERSSSCVHNSNVSSLGFDLFNNIIIFDGFVTNRLNRFICDLIETERNGSKIDINLVRNLIQMMHTLKVYFTDFEPFLLNQTSKFYQKYGEKLNSGYKSLAEYLNEVNKRLFDEKAKTYLDQRTINSNLQIVMKELIEEYKDSVIGKDIPTLLDQNSTNELELLYQFLNKVTNGDKLLKSSFKTYIIHNGTAIVESKDLNTIISQVISFRSRVHKVITCSFENDHLYHGIYESASKQFINLYPNKAPRLLAKYIDAKMRFKDLPDAKIKGFIAKITQIFKLLDGKDIFKAFYMQHFARRLLLGKSTSQDAELSIIDKLKVECGAAFTAHIEGMFHDITVSQALNETFKRKCENSEVKSEFNVWVLTSSNWPSYITTKALLPKDLNFFQSVFDGFYLQMHSGRKLTWQTSLGSCILKAWFIDGVKELQVSLFQAIVLLAYNECDKLQFKELKEQTNLDENVLADTLLSLSCDKVQILVDFDGGYNFNENYKNKLFRVKINDILVKESTEEDEQIEKRVETDRQYQIDAAIVRIMKKTKRISHSNLTSELCYSLGRLVPQSDLKKRVEMLIEREYIARDASNKSMYVYVA